MTDTVVDTLLIASLQQALQRQPQVQLMRLLECVTEGKSLGTTPNLIFAAKLLDLKPCFVDRSCVKSRRIRSLQASHDLLAYVSRIWEEAGEVSFGVMLEDFLAKQALEAEWLQREGATWIVEDDAIMAWADQELRLSIDSIVTTDGLVPA